MSEYVNFFIALFLIANPFAALPVFLKVTEKETSDEKKKTAVKASFYVALILFGASFVGGSVLYYLDIEVHAFRITGGIILLLLGLSMMNAEPAKLKRDEAVENEAAETSSGHAIVPLATPLIAGPGAISKIIIATTATVSFMHTLAIGLIGVLVAACIGLIWYYASFIEKKFGVSGINIFTRIGGLILTAMSIQAICIGLLGFFPGLSA